MGKLFYAVVVGAILFFAYKKSVLLGLAATVIFIAYFIYTYLPQIYCIIGKRKFGEGKYDEAAQWYKKAVDTGHAKGDIRMEYSYILLRTGDVDKAEQIVNEILSYKLKPQMRARAVIQRCMCYYKRGNIKEALDDAMELYNDGYRSIMLYGMIGFFMIETDPDSEKTFDFCCEAYEYANDDRDICDNMLICHYNRGEYERAKEISDSVLDAQPLFVEAWYHGAQIDDKLGDYAAALEKLERIKDCRRSFMTTIPESDVKELKQAVEQKLSE